MRFIIRTTIARAVGLTLLFGLNSATGAELADLIERVEPSVVRIDVSTDEGAAVGSGFVVSPNGIAVTNYHVMQGAVEGTATFNTGKSVSISGTLQLDKERDIAVIKLDATDLTSLPVADKLPRKGVSVVAFGAPRGLSFSASEGIVSGIRSSNELESLDASARGTWIQTTTPISPGNSGGPLVNSAGQVVGANTMSVIVGQNLNFAISCSDIAEAVADAKDNRTIPLREGTGRLASSSSTEPKAAGEIAPDKVSAEVLDRFINQGRDQLPSGIAVARKHGKQLQEQLRAMKAGRIGAKAKEGAEKGFDYFVVHIKGKDHYQFPDRDAMRRTISKHAAIVHRYETGLEKLEDPKVGLYLFLAELGGPQLALNSVGEIGWLRNAVVNQVVAGNAVHAYVGETRIEVRGVSGLANESEIAPMLAYVCAIRTYETRVGENTVLVVREFPKQLLMTKLGVSPAELIATSKPEVAAKPRLTAQPQSTAERGLPNLTSKDPSLRRWKDRSGKFDVEAVFVAQDETVAILKTPAGKMMTVPKSKLSAEDRDFLRTLQHD